MHINKNMKYKVRACLLKNSVHCMNTCYTKFSNSIIKTVAGHNLYLHISKMINLVLIFINKNYDDFFFLLELLDLLLGISLFKFLRDSKISCFTSFYNVDRLLIEMINSQWWGTINHAYGLTFSYRWNVQKFRWTKKVLFWAN